MAVNGCNRLAGGDCCIGTDFPPICAPIRSRRCKPSRFSAQQIQHDLALVRQWGYSPITRPMFHHIALGLWSDLHRPDGHYSYQIASCPRPERQQPEEAHKGTEDQLAADTGARGGKYMTKTIAASWPMKIWRSFCRMYGWIGLSATTRCGDCRGAAPVNLLIIKFNCYR